MISRFKNYISGYASGRYSDVRLYVDVTSFSDFSSFFFIERMYRSVYYNIAPFVYLNSLSEGSLLLLGYLCVTVKIMVNIHILLSYVIKYTNPQCLNIIIQFIIIDGSHIPIVAPSINAGYYVNSSVHSIKRK